jgi:integrase
MEIRSTRGVKSLSTSSDIVRLLDKIEDENGPAAADMTLAFLSLIFTWHAGRSDSFKSPIVRGMRRTSAKERQRSRILDDDELRRVWGAAQAMGGLAGAFIRFLLLTTARRTEAAEMTWAELSGRDWLLPAARNKTKQDLIRPLSDAALAVLAAVPRIDGCEFVFSTDGHRPISSFSDLKARFDQSCEVENWRLHDLRRTARSLMSQAGVNSDHAERCLGHALPTIRGTLTTGIPTTARNVMPSRHSPRRSNASSIRRWITSCR